MELKILKLFLKKEEKTITEKNEIYLKTSKF